ncbi:MAG: HNH endonuclease [Bdellovibrionota bacterium]
MTIQEIEDRLKIAVQDERKLAREILDLINLAEDQRIHLMRGYASLFDWLTKGLRYSEGAAQRRIQSARVLRKTPEVAEKIETGALNITNLAKAESYFRHENPSVEKKLEILSALEGKSTRESENVLATNFPNHVVQKEKIIPLDENNSKLITVISNETLGDLAKIRDELSHKFPNASLAEIITHLAKEAAEKCEKESCTFKDPKTGKICGTRYQSQSDHVQPRALGGTNDPENLRPLCRQHNMLRAEHTYGREFMDQWRRPH